MTLYHHAVDSQAKPAQAWQEWRGSGHILVVDDDEAVRTVLMRTLKRAGLSVSVAGNGAEALEEFAVETGRFSLVLLDFKLPGMDSKTLFRELRARRPDIPVILMSGYGQEEAMENSSAQDYIEFLHKPFTMGVLTAKVRDALGG
jgi:two-component system cell cycle sensor histidine kinase/response regulator CckA